MAVSGLCTMPVVSWLARQGRPASLCCAMLCCIFAVPESVRIFLIDYTGLISDRHMTRAQHVYEVRSAAIVEAPCS